MKTKNIVLVLLNSILAALILSGCGTAITKTLSSSITNISSSNAAPTTSTHNNSSSNDDSSIIAEDKEQMKDIDLNPKLYSDYYISKVTSFMNSYSGHGKIVFLGDSLTDMGNWSEMLNNPDILNRGISNDTTAGVFNRLSEVTRLKPRKIFIMLGINDIGKGIYIDDIIMNYSAILNKIEKDSPDTTIYVESVLPINKDIFKTSTSEKQITDLNSALSKLCKSYEIQYINLYPLFTVSNDELNPEYTEGGLHINGKGYLVWSQAIKQYCD